MDLNAQDPVTGAKVDPSDPGGSASSIVSGVGGVALGAGIISAGVAVYKWASDKSGDATPEFVVS